ncbi:MmcQ/YjbR family DNA-binding protein [Veillonella criceti]|uniref:Uncharacterized protein conserved in bacteria n=1 Tax=Veillonella criceti TaxID=103891 RepID=A0A380NIA2_9FIRM|nr:MmcQ/YjbR family DNA-binding protein [Veillonella criceti]SUP41777.1 Uncharacterized protein conserved in bacteria [Veillonella criceti]
MYYNEIFNTHIFNTSKALEYGFKKVGTSYRLTKELGHDTLEAEFEITNKSFKVTIYEEPEHIEYELFNVPSSEGAFIGKLRADVDKLIKEVIAHSFDSFNRRKELLTYVYEQYQTIPEEPWDKFASYCTLKTNHTKKWYGLFMNIPYKYLVKDRDGYIDVLNVKVLPETVADLVDYVHIFPAYHMNKKHWITIVLDQTVNIELVKTLLQNSYHLVEK